MRCIQQEIKSGKLAQGYQLSADDVGQTLGWHGFGSVLKADVGKRVWVKSYGLVMENCEQRDARQESGKGV